MMGEDNHYKFLDALNLLDDVVFAIDGKDRLIFANDAGSKLLGIPAANYPGMLFHDAPGVGEIAGSLLEAGRRTSREGPVEITTQGVASGKNSPHITWSVKPYNCGGASSDSIAIVYHAREIKVHQHVELPSQNEELLSTNFYHWPVAMFAWRRQGDDFVLIDVNRYADNMTDGNVRDFIGKTAKSMYAHSPEIIQDLEICHNQKSSFQKEIAYHFITTGQVQNLSVQYSYIPQDIVVVLAEVITDQKEMQEALRENEERLSAQFQNMPIPAYIWRREGEDFVLIDYNNASMEITQGKIPDFVGKTARQMYRNQPDILEHMQSCFENREVIREELPYKFVTTGRDRFLAVTYSFVPPDLVIVYTLDITERYHAEQELQESRNELEALLNATTDVAVLMDAEGQLSAVNKSFADRFNLSADKVKNRNFMEFISGPVADNRMRQVKEVVQSGHPKTFQDHRMGRYFENTYYPVFNDQKEVIKIACYGRDITQQKLSERALAETEKRYRQLVENLSEGIGIVDLDERFIFINPAGAQIFGCSADEILGKHLHDFLDQDNLALVGEQTEIRLKGLDSRYDLEIVRSDGTRRSLFVNATPMKDHGGAIIGTLGLFQDNTEQKIAREAARESESEMRALFNATKDIAFLMDIHGNLLANNEKLAEIFGMNPKELAKANVYDQLPNDIADSRRSQAKKVIETRMPVYFEDQREGRHFYNSVYPVFDEGGAVCKLAVFTQDLTEKEAIKKRLRESEKQYQAVVETSSDAIVIIQDGLIVYGNPFLSEMLDYPAEDLVGTPFLQYIHEKDREMIMEMHNRYVGGERNMGIFEIVALRRDGSLIDIDLDAGMLTYGGREAFLVTCRDVTDRKKAEQALRESEARLQLALRAVNEGLWDWNLITRKIYFSPRFYSMLEYNPGDLALSFDSWMDLTHSADRTHVEQTIKEYMQYKEKMFSIEFRMQTKTGTWRWILGRGMTVEHGEDGNPTRMVGTLIDITNRKNDEARLLDYQLRLKSLASQLVTTEARERKRIATELHDGICQLLASAKLQLSIPDDQETLEEKTNRFMNVKEILEMAYNSAKTLTYELTPPALYELGFEKAVEQYLDKMRSDFGINTICKVIGERKRLERSQEELLYRSVRELLMNVIKHAHANNVTVVVKRMKKSVEIEVDDDGNGCETLNDIMVSPNGNQGFGIFSIFEQLNNVGGQLMMKSKTNVGTKVFIDLPLNSQSTAKRGRE